MTSFRLTMRSSLIIAVALAAMVGLAGCDSAGPTQSFILLTEVSPEDGGTVTRSQPGEEYTKGTEVELTAEPADGWVFIGWEGDVPSNSSGSTVTITMNEDKTARALFKEEGGGAPLPSDRVRLGGKEIFSSGGNVAWIQFARDVGPGETKLGTFEDIFQQVKNSEGNSMRLWLHTNGQFTPAWDGSTVTGPGEGTIEDLRDILDLAEEYDVGLQFTLWSFDMLASNFSDKVVNRNYDLLTEPDLTETYIENALKPMVEQLGGHPAIIGWEIFNEPEGMTERYGFGRVNKTVTMEDVQRFVNLTAGAIHRTDPDALVTNGTWSFIALTDEPRPAAKAEEPEPLTEAELSEVQRVLSQKFRSDVSRAEAEQFVQQLQAQTDKNYYTDDRLINAGGDPEGTLDYYNVHYYEWAGTDLSPFHHDKSHWGLGAKPVVVGEFYMGTAKNDDDGDASFGVEYENFYTTLYDRGYAGAMGWSWFGYYNNEEGSRYAKDWPRMLENMEDIYSEQPGAVEVSL